MLVAACKWIYERVGKAYEKERESSAHNDAKVQEGETVVVKVMVMRDGARVVEIVVARDDVVIVVEGIPFMATLLPLDELTSFVACRLPDAKAIS